MLECIYTCGALDECLEIGISRGARNADLGDVGRGVEIGAACTTDIVEKQKLHESATSRGKQSYRSPAKNPSVIGLQRFHELGAMREQAVLQVNGRQGCG